MTDILLIGERINSTNKRIRQILEIRDETALLHVAREQVQGGASFIDINASMLMKEEEQTLRWAAGCITAVMDVGVSLDSPNIDVLSGVLPEIRGRVMLNSFTCDEEPLERAINAIAGYGASVIVMLKSRDGIPETVDGRMHLAGRIAAAADAAGASPSRIYIDPVFSPIATSANGMQVTLATLGALRASFPGYHRIGGLSNVSYGMPKRKLINRTSLAMVLSHGLDAVICDTTDPALMETAMASGTIIGLDPGCRRFLQSYREKRFG
ncbi:MAG TPA: dihydropteroate synthase [Patescibacteria group bacterium]|nr:dihydropteroate synthase [Patescibacteria group bacterium]